MEHSYKGEEKFLVNDLKTIVSKARSKAFAAVNYSLVERNWRIGKRIVEEEQNGEARAEYGKHIIEVASAALTEEFGKGFSVTTLRVFRRFYLKFSNLQIQRTVSVEFKASIQQTPSEELSNNLQHVQKSRYSPTTLVALRTAYSHRRQAGKGLVCKGSFRARLELPHIESQHQHLIL